MFFDSVRDFIRNMTRQEIIKWSSAYVGVCILGIIIIMIRHNLNSAEWSSKILQLNKARAQAQQIFTNFNIVQQEKNKIDEALKQNKNFNIQKYFQDLINQQALSSQVTSKFSYEKLPNGYIQENLAINCVQLSTQQLCELIVAIEKQPLIYIIAVDISHQVHTKKINVNMSIATLRAEE